MNKIKLKYDPNLSVRENAVRCGVSESAIRKFIRTNGIDRNYDNKVVRKRAILALRKTLSKILCKWEQDSVISFFLYLYSVFKDKHKLVHNQSPV